MNNPNPFVPQTTLLDQKNKTRARFRFAILTILGCNIALVCVVLLFQGCKRDSTASTDGTDATHTNPEMAAETTTPSIPPLGASNGLANTTTPITAPVATPITAPVVTPTTTPTPPDLGHSGEYVVVKGDLMADIAKKNHVTLAALKAANPTVDPTKMKIGTKLTIPAPAAAPAGTTGNMANASTGGADSYTVKAGDNLTTIAKNHGTTVTAIQALNNLKSTRINAGQTLRMPPHASAAMNTETPAVPTTPGGNNPVPSSTSLR